MAGCSCALGRNEVEQRECAHLVYAAQQLRDDADRDRSAMQHRTMKRTAIAGRLPRRKSVIGRDALQSTLPEQVHDPAAGVHRDAQLLIKASLLVRTDGVCPLQRPVVVPHKVYPQIKDSTRGKT